MDIQGAVADFITANVTFTTTTENIFVSTPLLRINRNSAIVMIAAWGILTTGTATTTVTPRIRRGTAITDTLVSAADTVTVGAAAGSNEQFQMVCFEQLTSEQVVRYSFTLQQVSATGNGTGLVAGIMAIAV